MDFHKIWVYLLYFLSCYFGYIWAISWLPDISKDYPISQLSSPTDYQKCWCYFYPCIPACMCWHHTEKSWYHHGCAHCTGNLVWVPTVLWIADTGVDINRSDIHSSTRSLCYQATVTLTHRWQCRLVHGHVWPALTEIKQSLHNSVHTPSQSICCT